MSASNDGYGRLSQNEQDILDPENSDNRNTVISQGFGDIELPVDPPIYNELSEIVEERPPFEQMGFQELEEVTHRKSFRQYWEGFQQNVIIPFKRKFWGPLNQLYMMSSEKLDYYLNKVGNPLILRRYVYILFMSFIVYYVSMSKMMPNNVESGTHGMFSDTPKLIEYAGRCINYAKMEQDLEYLSSMPHIAGTKGDFAMMDYVKESFTNNGLRSTRVYHFPAVINYAGEAAVSVYGDGVDKVVLDLSEENFNPMATAGKVEAAQLIYGHYGTEDDLKRLEDAHLLNENTVLLLHYDSFVANQVLLCQERGIKGILFISKSLDGKEDVIQRFPVGIPHYGFGNPSSAGYSAKFLGGAQPDQSLLIPKIPTIPISAKQGSQLKGMLSKSDRAVDFKNGWHSGGSNKIKIDMSLDPIQREDQPSWNVVSKIDGKEQSDKSIIIAAARDSTHYGASYPNFGQMLLLELVELFQQVKYKYDWKPLRNIYFISFDASMYNSAGATSLLKNNLAHLQEEAYAFLDITQLSVDPKGSKNIEVQCTPLLHEFFTKKSENFGFQLDVTDVKQYGQWVPYMTNGIPVIVFSSPHISKMEAPALTSEDTFSHLTNQTFNVNNGWATTGEMLLFLFQASLKLVDNPLIQFNILDYVRDLNVKLQDLAAMSKNRLNLQPIYDALVLWQKIGEDWRSWAYTWNNIFMNQEGGREPSMLAMNRWAWNRKLTGLYRAQVKLSGLPGRAFFKNLVSGPALRLSNTYDSWSFPGVRDAVQREDWETAQQQVIYVGNILKLAAAKFIEDVVDF
ncbi:HEL121Cp [Eremothecium sinecaudum]|uniref:HEL121Cp n=1 Tax=Eremothecium sinecaudum TaxID=45286 RepID=A0A0X8HTH7_9SACH|nr:HEL121Cp [Eremothecium sinecaudum]AMD21159.1 HEL121Cp [Eremothecium sinecaudum]